jgi:uncharacterized damage-inducible protein DinB
MINRPQANEYPPYAEAYVSMIPAGANILQVLTDSKSETFELFSNLNEEKASHAYAEGKWTVKQVLGHMIDTERVFAFRAFCFSREQITLPGFDQDIYVANTDYNSQTINSLAEEFKATRESNLYMFRALSDEQIARTGTASGHSVTVRALLYLTAGHVLHHIKILNERYW